MNNSRTLGTSASVQVSEPVDTDTENQPSIIINTYREVMERSMSVNWLVNSLLPADSTVMYYGAPGSGKSLIVLELAYCIANGLDWYGMPCQQGAVVYISSEGQNGLKRRMKSIETKYSFDNPECTLLVISHQVDLRSSEMMSELGKVLAGVDDIKLVIFDTLHRNFTGDENSAKDWGQAQANCDKLRNTLSEASILIVHHTGKDSDKGYRGSASILGSVDVCAKVTNKKDGITLEHEKTKDTELPENMNFAIRSTMLIDENGDEVSAPYLVEGIAMPVTKVASKEPSNHEKNKQILIDTASSMITSFGEGLGVYKKELQTETSEQLIVGSNSSDAKRKAFTRAFDDLLSDETFKLDDDLITIASSQNDHVRTDGRTTSP